MISLDDDWQLIASLVATMGAATALILEHGLSLWWLVFVAVTLLWTYRVGARFIALREKEKRLRQRLLDLVVERSNQLGENTSSNRDIIEAIMDVIQDGTSVQGQVVNVLANVAQRQIEIDGRLARLESGAEEEPDGRGTTPLA